MIGVSVESADKQKGVSNPSKRARAAPASTDNAQTGKFSMRLKINHPVFEFEVTTDDARTLEHIKEILELVPIPGEMTDDTEGVFNDVALKLTDAFTANVDVASLLRELLRRGQGYRIAATEIPATSTLDMETGVRGVRLRRADIQRHVRALVSGIDASAVRSGIIHICGSIDAADKRLIADHISHHFKTADLRAFQSPRDKDQTAALVECIFFGAFPDEED